MRDSVAESRVGRSSAGPSRPSQPHTSAPSLPRVDEWLAGEVEALGTYWYREVVRRGGVTEPAVRTILRDLTGFMASMVPASVSVERKAVLDVCCRTAALYGSLGCLRGLAAGEVVEEIQILREAILRVVFSEPAVLIGADLKLREALRINRFVDELVTQASVSHTDDLFFQLLEGNGVPSTPTPDLLAEIKDQLKNLMIEAEDFLTFR